MFRVMSTDGGLSLNLYLDLTAIGKQLFLSGNHEPPLISHLGVDWYKTYSNLARPRKLGDYICFDHSQHKSWKNCEVGIYQVIYHDFPLEESGYKKHAQLWHYFKG